MATADKLGPGQLTLGEEGTPSEWGAAVTEVLLEPDTDEGDALYFLDGSEDSDEETTWTLSGKVAQSFDQESLLIWAKEHAGQQLPFTFRPRNEGALVITGKVTVRAVAIGGDVRKKNLSDFEWKCIGEPEHAFTALGTTTPTA